MVTWQSHLRGHWELVRAYKCRSLWMPIKSKTHWAKLLFYGRFLEDVFHFNMNSYFFAQICTNIVKGTYKIQFIKFFVHAFVFKFDTRKKIVNINFRDMMDFFSFAQKVLQSLCWTYVYTKQVCNSTPCCEVWKVI